MVGLKMVLNIVHLKYFQGLVPLEPYLVWWHTKVIALLDHTFT